MLEKFPYIHSSSKLSTADYRLFSMSYGKILKKRLPTSCETQFFVESTAFEEMYSSHPDHERLVNLFHEAQNGMISFGVQGELILLPFIVEDGTVVAIISDTDPIFQQKVDQHWLIDVAGSAERDFILLKEARVDNQTGLLNLSNLTSLLDNAPPAEGLSLILLELLPKRFSYQQTYRHVIKCTSLLKRFVSDVSGLHYLGNCTFALVLKDARVYEKNEIESSLVAYLRRAGCNRVHLGSSNSTFTENADLVEAKNQSLLDEAWTAICHARKLGPFSFSNYQYLVHPEAHPLAPVDRKLVRKISRLWSKSDKFYLIQFVIESRHVKKEELLLSLLNRGHKIIFGNSIYLYLEDANLDDITQWLRDIAELYCKENVGTEVFVGVGYYPLLDYSKTETILNCKKAVLHASFYQQSSVVVFDAVSLNISGDVFFGEGNLTKAAKEYRQGLKYDDQDINLYNSLGVTLAQMDKLHEANTAFQKALAVNPSHFMTFYNLGLVEQKRNDKAAALDYFKKAEKTFSKDEGGLELLQDLQLQLGLLSCGEGKYQEAVDYLQNWYENNPNNPHAGRVYYYLGRAFWGLNNNQYAMGYLQKALQFDEFDAGAMNLLGLIYAKEKQGNDIAISLCRKSVELEPDDTRYKLQLARVYFLSGFYHEAKKNVCKCLRTKDIMMEARLLLGDIYLAQGRIKRAANWFEKVKAQSKIAQELAQEAERRLQELD